MRYKREESDKMDSPIKIVIADDHSMIREGLKQLLELDGDIQVIGEAGDGEECLEVIKKLHPDVLLLDINMPKKNGLDVLEELRANGSKQKVLILTIHNEAEYLMKAKEIGINGYVLKDSESTILKRAISIVNNDEEYIDTAMIPLLHETTKRYYDDEDYELTKREKEVLKLVCDGLYNKEIADKLGISEKTVKNHVSNILRKFGVFDRTQAVIHAIRNNLLDLK